MLHGWKDNSMSAEPLAACTYLSSIVSELYAGASPGETKMWAAVRKNGDFLTVVNYTIFAAIIDSFMSN